MRAGFAAGDEAGKRPAVWVLSGRGGSAGFQFARRLEAAGYYVRQNQRGGLLTERIDPAELRKYNVMIMAGLALSEPNEALTDLGKQQIKVLRDYLDEGGGIMVFPHYQQLAAEIPPQRAFLMPLGLEPLLEDAITDTVKVQATPWDLDFAYTDAITPGQLTEGVRGIWYSITPRLLGDEQHSSTMAVDDNWTVLVRGSKTSSSKTLPINATLFKTPGTGDYKESVPLVASRQVGKGRMVVVGMCADYLLPAHASTSLESIVAEKGLNGKLSDGYKLVQNCLAWLAEPSAKAGISAERRWTRSCCGTRTKWCIVRLSTGPIPGAICPSAKSTRESSAPAA